MKAIIEVAVKKTPISEDQHENRGKGQAQIAKYFDRARAARFAPP
jgi:hypothetical protein